MLESNHLQEWLQSGVHPSLIALNVRSLNGPAAIEAILSEAIANRQKVTSYVTVGSARLLERYRHLENGGWWVEGLDPLACSLRARSDFEAMAWGQLKPDAPRCDADGKLIKYEAPKDLPARVFLLRASAQTTLQTCLMLEQQYGAVFQAAIAAARARLNASPDLDQEDPIFWEWVHTWNLPIVVTEGAKKAAALLSQGYPTIALPGITMGLRTRDEFGTALHPSQHKLIPDLAWFATRGREFNLCFDFETKPKTIAALERETEKLQRALRSKGCDFKILALPGPEKGVDDFIVAQGAAALHTCFQQRLSVDRAQVRRLSQFTHPATVSLNQRFLGNLEIPDAAQLVLLKSPKGTGKTESFKQIVAEASAIGQRVLLLSHRVQLAQAICNRVGLPYVTELRQAEEGALLGYGLCVDSLHPESQARFDAQFWHGAIVIIDECEQVFLHLLEAKTEVEQRRTTILGQLKELLCNTIGSDRGKIILSDADLSNISLEFVWGLLEEKIPPHIICNAYKPTAEAWQVYNYDQHQPDQWIAALCQEIESGGKPFVITQSQQAKSRWGTSTLETYLRAKYPQTQGLRIDSLSISDPSHPAYQIAGQINEVITQYDWVVASPTIETGISIDVRGHFTSVWGCLGGVTAENSARQSLARLRDPVDRHVWIRKRGTNPIGNGSTTVRGLLGGEQQVAQAAAKLIQTICYQEDLIGAFAQSLRTWAKFVARINAGMIHYRESVLDGLEREGHHIHPFHPQLETAQILLDLKATRASGVDQICAAISQAEPISEKEFLELKNKKAKTAAERHQERKFAIEQRYQVAATPELVEKDLDGWYPRLRLFYFLGIGKSFLKDRDEQSLDATIKTAGPWLPTLNRAQVSTRIWLLERLGIPELLNLDAEFNSGRKANQYADAHPALKKLTELATTGRNPWIIKNLLGVTISDQMSPLQIAQTLLGKLGVKLRCDRQIGGTNQRQRVYVYELPKDGRNEILAGWFARDSLKQAELHTPPISNRDSQGVRAA